MSLNRKMIRNTIIGCLVIVLLVIGYFAVQKWQPGDGSDGKMGDKSIQILSFDEQRVSKVVYKNGNESFSLVRIGETNWNIPEMANIKFSQNKLNTAVYNLLSIRAIKTLDNKEDMFLDFGLEDSDKKVTIYTEDDEITLVLGDKVAVDSNYYLMKKGDKAVYIIPGYSADSITKKPNDFRETAIAKIDTADITRLDIKYNNQQILTLKQAETSQDSLLQLAKLTMTYPYKEGLNAESLEKFLAAFNAVNVIDFVSDNLSDSTKYGLDKGWCVEIKTDENIHRICIGDSDNAGNVYTTYNDCGFIFTMSPNIQNAIRDVNLFNLIDKFAHLYMMDDVSTVTISFGADTHIIRISKYSIDEKILTGKVFKDIYAMLVGLTVDDIVKNELPKGKIVAQITFNMLDGNKYTTKYFEYDDRFLMAEKSNNNKYLILKKDIYELKDNIIELSR